MIKYCMSFLVISLMLISTPALSYDRDIFQAFPYHNSVFTYEFSTSTTDYHEFFTSSYGAGGLVDPAIYLWDSNGDYIGYDDDREYSEYDSDPNTTGHPNSAFSNGVEYFFGEFDSYMQILLNPGSYFLSVSSYENPPEGHTSDAVQGSLNLADGFTLDESEPVDWYQDEGFVTVHLTNITPSNGPVPTPEPSSFLLLGAGLLGAIILARKRFSDKVAEGL